jgi:hypothetical protein
MSPRGDEEKSFIGSFANAPASSKMPQMQGHHSFNPKEASTLLIAEESPSFYQKNKIENSGITSMGMTGANNHARITDIIFKQNDSNFDESRPSEIPSMLHQTSQSFLPVD